MDQEKALRELETIRGYLDRAERYSNLSGTSCLVAGALAVAGSAVCLAEGLKFVDPDVDRVRLGGIWAAVAALAFAQNAAFTVAMARRKAEPVWSRLTRAVALAVAPGFLVSAVLTVALVQENLLGFLPGVWMLCYGVSLVGLSLFAGTHIRLVGIAFLAVGAVAALAAQEQGVLLMGVTFGGFHLGVGAWILWRYRA